jgi:hypothetical protein
MKLRSDASDSSALTTSGGAGDYYPVTGGSEPTSVPAGTNWGLIAIAIAALGVGAYAYTHRRKK